MAQVDVLVTGYVARAAGGDAVHPTVSLVRSGRLNVIVDPGLLTEQSVLLDALATHGLAPKDITHVFVTHHHIDHTRNIGMFPVATVVDVDSLYSGDVWAEHEGDGYALAPDITVLHTPGHAAECASLMVDTDDGTVVLTHAWWFPDMTPVEDPLAADQRLLEASRERILAVADIVVPGHGAAFRPGVH